MVRPRVIETDQGIQGDFNVQIYDGMMRRLRDKGWMETDPIITSMNAAYTVEEMQCLLKQTELKEAIVTRTSMGFEITGEKI
jgi:hypothetical protein